MNNMLNVNLFKILTSKSFKMFQVFLGFILTVLIGGYLAYRYQKRNIVYQSSILLEKNRLETIHSVIRLLSQVVHNRLEKSELVLELYKNRKNIKDIENNPIRIDYLASKDNWVAKIEDIIIELENIDLDNYENEIKYKISRNFFLAHGYILKVKEKFSVDDFVIAQRRLNDVRWAHRQIIKRLREDANIIIDNIKYDNTEALSRENLHNASIKNLIFALFYKNPSLLHVQRS